MYWPIDGITTIFDNYFHAPKLQELDLSFNSITTLHFLEWCPELKRLILKGCKALISIDVNLLRRYVKGLRVLDISNCIFIRNVPVLDEIAMGLPQLQELYAYDIAITLPSLSRILQARAFNNLQVLGGMNDLFKKMFSDSEIVSLYSMSDSKYRYLTTFGIAPHFAKLLSEDVKASPGHCILFDESLNDELQTKQLDIHVRFWSDRSLKVETRYYDSLFIGHGRAVDLLDHYTEVTKDLDSALTWQVGMDGPNVNISFHKKLMDQRRENDLPDLLDLGTCGLHIIHRAFQTGAKATDWDLDQYFLKEYKLFKDSPARREDFVSYTGSTVFPSKFCNHRWLENLDVAGKSLTLMESVKEYCMQAELNKTEPQKHAGYNFVKKMVTSDKFLKAKHLFWITVAQEFQPFLKLYQADRPLIPFLASDLENLLRSVMVRFVKDDILTSATSYLKLAEIDTSTKDNLKSAKSVEIGIATKRKVGHCTAHIKKCGGVMKVNIDQDLRNAARRASSSYRTEQKKQQEAEKVKEKQAANETVNTEILALKGKRRRIVEDSIQLKESVDKLMERAEKERSLLHVTKANSFKRTIRDMEREAEEIDATIESLKKKLKQ
ncbi:hypothetical protein AC249_AIPGENE7592 [Exaiptasia diaphana]|nr:hypothetical protein AC249_AIPGENE7592 [Exaiptasia diaphana]